ncbi:electron transport complex subunit RsxE [Pelotomaculum terephthalicicum JT]|uniref:electron transport complex subunit RsxE n=1 Tax=Pelotomaculum TaxID=191373 RepID=UPI0009D59C29|nr:MULTISPECIES: electron transport complex subunit RsxE [Pelotomaculum]MCG9967214.1 electron transport complex subunit RsxE [Pelotomaculum terephthalicicum JT]OPX91129.1 MAG: Electron transport complex protein RnfE [Pelotomaculum sp. PtaB.Bin117]OPY61543.1 MAG: Electron transport complex protein RnfE [Pelotomaculum sp. PtaU1.Bin065]
MKELWSIFNKGLILENPIFVLALSLCPALAVTSSVIVSLTMGLTVMFVITANNTVVSIVRNLVNPKVRVPVYIVSIATIVTVAQLVLQAYLPDLYKALGIYLALVVVFAIILARAEVFASKNGVIRSFFDGLGMGTGFLIAMLIIGAIREIIGSGTFLGIQVMPASYNAPLMLVLPAGAFILIGYLVAGCKMLVQHIEKSKA